MAAKPGRADPAPARTAASIVARHDPDAHRRSLARRDTGDLPFNVSQVPPDLPVMPDTNVYIRRLQGKLPPEIGALLLSRTILHSAVACSELAISAGILDPAHAGTASVRRAIMGVLDAIADLDMVAPSAEAWTEAGIVAGILARTQHLAKSRKALTADQACCQEGLRRKLLNDALIFLSACERGAILVSANSKDMDLLLRFRPEARVLLFR